jgi:hypothetical protein
MADASGQAGCGKIIRYNRTEMLAEVEIFNAPSKTQLLA